MDWIEIIQLRSHSSRHRDGAIAAFAQLSPPPMIGAFKGISLFRNRLLENDLCISIPWQGPMPAQRKSRLGFQLAAAFSEFGQINHSAWICEKNVTLKTKEKAS